LTVAARWVRALAAITGLAAGSAAAGSRTPDVDPAVVYFATGLAVMAVAVLLVERHRRR